MSNNNHTPKILDDLKKINYKKKIKIRYKKLKSGGYSLYLDIWHNGKRDYEILKIYILGKTNTKADDENKLRRVIAYRDRKEQELLEMDTGFSLSSTHANFDFLSYFKSLIDKGTKNDINWIACYKHLKKFMNGKELKIKDIDKKFLRDFIQYLTESMKKITANMYFSKVKAALNLLVEEEIIETNPARNINIKSNETKREFLTLDEIKRLQKIKLSNEEVKNAFLFSCFTGLRISDIRLLIFNRISDGYLIFDDKKTKNQQRTKLNKTALEILEKQRRRSHDKHVFHLPDNNTVLRVIRKWVKEVGINKHITFHCARHTFATLCLTYDIDLFTVSKLLGHKDIKTTQIYAKLIDKKKDEAIDKLPRI